MKLTIIIPVYFEGSAVWEAYKEVRAVLNDALPEFSYEILFVDDGSQDDSFEHITRISEQDPNVCGIKFASNYGAHTAIRAGLEHATGDAACFLACDLQDPPSLIPQMLEKLGPDSQIVAAVRNARQDPWTSRCLSSGFHLLARNLVSADLPAGGASMYLLGPHALVAMRQFKERNMTLEGLFLLTGHKLIVVPYERRPRTRGGSKWTLAKRLKLFADFFVAYSYTPLRVMSLTGCCVAALGFLYSVFLAINRIFLSNPIQGWTAVMIAILILSGLQMTMFGVLGEYLWRILDEVRARPIYRIARLTGHLASMPDERLGEH